ncbi:glutathione S-transferase [Verminephrobacter aporrectodeae subsp. tuberculatae]|uniref:glutathione S-transferase n=1 Tax=Verminephrobacter aporrectodeae TaxID=1110389 RepID=UPI0022434F36|nr:glutathione S-transferase [Verminephrobacter aporrectodeae]MCW8200547.1 glutathione S-transferase [Verminephrobacter aporrectodeae subsp. tuberculatae]
MNRLTIWGRRDSFNVQKVLWLLDELALTYDWRPAGGQFGGLDDTTFRAMNPHGRIPVVLDDGEAIWESHTILRYLANKYGGEIFRASDPFARSLEERWMDWMLTTLQPDFLTGVFWSYYRTPEDKQQWDSISQKIANCADHIRLIDRQLVDRHFLCGDRLSLADIAVGVTCYRYYELDIDRPYTPHVEHWYSKLQLRAPYRNNVMLPFTHLKGRLDY